jgi:hypothetical protein
MGLRLLGIALLAVLTSVASVPTRAEPLAIVVSSDWDTPAVDLSQLRAVYLGRRTELFGRRVKRIDLPSGSPSRAGFSRSVLGRREAALERYWIEQALAGGPLPPRQVSSVDDAIAAVQGHVGVIAYVPVSELALRHPEGIRAIPVIVDGVPRRPEDAAYPLHTRD